jgi:hypothetical protein
VTYRTCSWSLISTWPSCISDCDYELSPIDCDLDQFWLIYWQVVVLHSSFVTDCNLLVIIVYRRLWLIQYNLYFFVTCDQQFVFNQWNFETCNWRGILTSVFFSTFFLEKNILFLTFEWLYLGSIASLLEKVLCHKT